MSVLYKEGDTMPMLAGRVSEILREAKVPSVLWGRGYYSLLGMGRADHAVALMVEDEDMNKAICAIRKAGCLETHVHYVCVDCGGYGPESEEGMEEMMILGDSNYCFRANPHPIVRSDYQSDRDFVEAVRVLDEQRGFTDRNYPHIGLYLKSQFMWTMPKFSLDDPPENDEHFMRASDIALPGRQPFREHRYSPAYGQVVTLTPAAFVQVLILCVVRCANFTGKIQEGDRDLLSRLTKLPDAVAPHFENDFLDILNYSRFPDGIREIWMLVNSIETDDPLVSKVYGRDMSREEREAFEQRVLRLGRKMAGKRTLPQVMPSWRFKPGKEVVLQ